MPYTSITSGTNTFVPREPGIYVEDSVTFADPQRELRIRGASKNKNGSLSGSITYVLEKDVTLSSGAVVRRPLVIPLQIQATADFTAAEIIDGVKAVYDFVNTTGFTNRFMQGES